MSVMGLKKNVWIRGVLYPVFWNFWNLLTLQSPLQYDLNRLVIYPIIFIVTSLCLVGHRVAMFT